MYNTLQVQGCYPATRLARGSLRAENNLRDAIHEARARAYHTQTSEGDQHNLTPDDGSLHHGCCGLHCGHVEWSRRSADR